VLDSADPPCSDSAGRPLVFRDLRYGVPMTKADWQTCTDPARMLDFLRDTATDRQLRLFACAWGRDVWRHLSDQRSRDAIVTAERFVDGAVTFADLLAAHREAAYACSAIPLAHGRHRDGTRRRPRKNRSNKEAAEIARHAADPEWDARVAGRAVAWKGASTRYALSNHLRDIFNPFHAVPVAPEWRTSTVLTLARCAYDSGDSSTMPILADALQDADCDNEEMLIHCRADVTHIRGCWVIDALLGKE
jgi:hypothetical protein